MIQIRHFLFLFCLFSACQTIPESQTSPKPVENRTGKDFVYMQDDLPILKRNNALTESEYKIFFDSCGISDACFLLHNLKHNAYNCYNRGKIDVAVSPASTFKIFNSLVALETKAVEDTNTLIKWDGVWREVKAWNQNHTMKTAFKCSAVWFYQELARRIGAKQMKSYLTKSHYGNASIEGEIDHFWLSGELKISPMEQVMFLEKLYKEDGLPFSAETQKKVKSIMIEEQNEKGTLRAKTGWGILGKDQEAENIGWYVGYVEKKHNQYFFALCMHAKGKARDDFGSCRKEIVLKILKKLEIWE